MTASDLVAVVFFRFDDFLVAGPAPRLPAFAAASGFESDAPPAFDFGSEVDLPFAFAGAAAEDGGGAHKSGWTSRQFYSSCDGVAFDDISMYQWHCLKCERSQFLICASVNIVSFMVVSTQVEKLELWNFTTYSLSST